jgi:hypothetical protein
MCFDIAEHIQKVKMAAGGAPSSTTNNVTGAIVVVSSVPETRPIAENRTDPSNPRLRAMTIS